VCGEKSGRVASSRHGRGWGGVKPPRRPTTTATASPRPRPFPGDDAPAARRNPPPIRRSSRRCRPRCASHAPAAPRRTPPPPSSPPRRRRIGTGRLRSRRETRYLPANARFPPLSLSLRWLRSITFVLLQSSPDRSVVSVPLTE
jgi:hypothetical protein